MYKSSDRSVCSFVTTIHPFYKEIIPSMYNLAILTKQYLSVHQLLHV